MSKAVHDSISWAKDHNVQISDSIGISETHYAGWGIVAAGDISEDQIILKIPSELAFDLNSLLKHLNWILEQNEACAQIIKTALACAPSPTETLIIRAFMWGFSVLQSMGHHELLQFVEKYLNVLNTTDTLDVDENYDCSSDSLVQWQIDEKRSVHCDHDTFLEESPELLAHLSFEMAFRLHQAIKSRTLEIPHALDDDGEYEYQTRITLVPMLDFANHAFDYNAKFDVERDTDAIILKLTKHIKKGNEVFISYSSSQQADSFLKTYGFIPSDSIFTWRVPNLDSLLNSFKGTTEEKYTLISKWLQVRPEITFKMDNGAAEVVDGECRLPYLMIPKLTYFKNWCKEVSDITEDGYDVGQLLRLEADADIIPVETAYGVVFEDAYVSVPDILAQTWDESEVGVKELLRLTMEFLKKAIEHTLADDKAYLSHISNENQCLLKYFDHKARLLNCLLRMSPHSLLRPSYA